MGDGEGVAHRDVKPLRVGKILSIIHDVIVWFEISFQSVQQQQQQHRQGQGWRVWSWKSAHRTNAYGFVGREREWGLKVSYAFVVGSYSLEAGARTGASRQESESNAQVAVRVSTQCSQGKASPEKKITDEYVKGVWAERFYFRGLALLGSFWSYGAQ